MQIRCPVLTADKTVDTTRLQIDGKDINNNDKKCWVFQETILLGGKKEEDVHCVCTAVHRKSNGNQKKIPDEEEEERKFLMINDLGELLYELEEGPEDEQDVTPEMEWEHFCNMTSEKPF